MIFFKKWLPYGSFHWIHKPLSGLIHSLIQHMYILMFYYVRPGTLLHGKTLMNEASKDSLSESYISIRKTKGFHCARTKESWAYC